MTIQQALDYIHSVNWRGSIPGLSRTQELLARMGNPEKRLRFVHVAGTNGKGSTCAMLERILREAGFRTGLYTSPYITCFNERMQVCGEPISDEMLCRITEFVRPFADAMEDIPTEFELVSAIGFEYFARMNCDIVILECGMGGELDSTNVIPTPECAVICTIGLDHTQFLGSTVTEIARTKAGIFKPGGCCVTYPTFPEVETLYDEIARSRALRMTRADFGRIHPVSHDLTGQEFVFDGFGALHLSLLGENQLHNCALALTVVEVLREKGWRISDTAVAEGLRLVQWPGRFEVLRRDPDVIADGGHNPQCLQALRDNLQLYLPGRDLVALVGVLADKDYAEMFRPLVPYVRCFVAVAPPNPRALSAQALARTLQSLGAAAICADSIAGGVEKAMSLVAPGGALVCFGSLYMLGQIRAEILEDTGLAPS